MRSQRWFNEVAILIAIQRTDALSLPQRMWIESKTDNIPRYRAQACHRASKKRKLFHSKQAKTWVIVELMCGPASCASSPMKIELVLETRYVNLLTAIQRMVG